MVRPETPFAEGAAKQLAEDLIETYGEGAELAAADRYDAMRELGRAEAAKLWSEVVEILARMRGRGRRPDA